MDPADFERLIADYFLRRGFVRAEVIGHSGDRGVDVLATNTQGELELIQCKRYRSGNNIGSTPIQRVEGFTNYTDDYISGMWHCDLWNIT